MELTTEFDMMSQKTFGSSHPSHLFTDHLLHIESAMVFSLKERRDGITVRLGNCYGVQFEERRDRITVVVLIIVTDGFWAAQSMGCDRRKTVDVKVVGIGFFDCL